jgi:hypothetical protein
MTDRLKEEKKLSPADLKFKVKKLESYVRRADQRINALEKKLLKIEREMQSQPVFRKKVLV